MNDSYELGIRDVREFFSDLRQFLLLPKTQKSRFKRLYKTKNSENMEGEEERGSVREENSQKDAAADETSIQTQCSQTPQLPSSSGIN